MRISQLTAAVQAAFGRFQIRPSQSLALLTIAFASSAGAQNVDTTSGWNGTTFISSWGVPNTATYGQTITPTASQTNLLSFTFNYAQQAPGTQPQYQAFIYQWSGTRITGPALYSSNVLTATNSTSFVPVTFSTGGTRLTANQQYVLFLTTSTVTPQVGSPTYRWGSVSNSAYAGGQFVYMNNGTVFGDLSSYTWNSISSDLAFMMTFTPPVSQVYEAVVSQGNSPAFNAAKVIDSHSNLSALFQSQTGASATSSAASQTLPLLIGGTTFATQSALTDINRVIGTRLEANRGRSSGDDFYGDKNIWMKPFGSWADQNTRDNVAGYKATTLGIVFGAEGNLSPALRVGSALAYAKSDINGKSDLSKQSADVEIYHLTGYGSYRIDEHTDIDFQAGFGQNRNKGHRGILFASSVASSSFDSQTAHAGVALRHLYALNSQTSLTSSAYADYIWIKEKGYTETGAGDLNLSVDGRTTDALVLGVNGKLAHQVSDQTTLIANLGLGYDTLNGRAKITSVYAGAPDAAFITYGIDPTPWLVRAGLGAVYKTKSGVEIVGRYDAEYRESFLNQSASVKARWVF